jgi:hypothetical protein
MLTGEDEATSTGQTLCELAQRLMKEETTP